MRVSANTWALLAATGGDPETLVGHVRRAVDEDLAYGPDLTTLATVPDSQRVRARFASREPGVLCGLGLAAAVLDIVVGSDRWRVLSIADDGQTMAAGAVALEVEAPTCELLTAERTALNFLGHLSGVATLTARWVQAVADTGMVVRDTRKTTPGWRVLDKYAVRCGGGTNHRMGLGDAALIKDNHVVAAGGVRAAVDAVRALNQSIPVEVECDSLDQVQSSIEAGVSMILLDNMTIDQLAAAVELVRRSAPNTMLEASGGIRLESVRSVAESGVDFVAVGALTHSAPVLDLGLDVIEVLARLDQ